MLGRHSSVAGQADGQKTSTTVSNAVLSERNRAQGQLIQAWKHRLKEQVIMGSINSNRVLIGAKLVMASTKICAKFVSTVRFVVAVVKRERDMTTALKGVDEAFSRDFLST